MAATTATVAQRDYPINFDFLHNNHLLRMNTHTHVAHPVIATKDWDMLVHTKRIGLGEAIKAGILRQRLHGGIKRI